MFATPVTHDAEGAALTTAPRLSDMGVEQSSAKRFRPDRDISFEEVRDAAYRWKGSGEWLHPEGDEGSTLSKLVTTLLEREMVLLERVAFAEGEARDLRAYSSQLSSALGNSIRAHQALDSAIADEEASGKHLNEDCPLRPQLEEVTSAVSFDTANPYIVEPLAAEPLNIPPYLLWHEAILRPDAKFEKGGGEGAAVNSRKEIAIPRLPSVRMTPPHYLHTNPHKPPYHRLFNCTCVFGLKGNAMKRVSS